MKNFPSIFWIVLISLFLKLLLLPFAQTVDADAVTRIFDSITWMQNPHWIKSSVWAPFHFYFNAGILYLWNDPILAPKVMNILFSSLTLIPFYYLTKREFNHNGAMIAAIFLLVSPILFRNSFVALSETPYLFFLALTLNFLSKGFRNKSDLHILMAGISITIAAGLRYEAWVLIVIFGFFMLFFRQWKSLVIFCSSSLLFPISWLVTNWLETGNPFFGIQGNYHWTLEMMGNNDDLDFGAYLRRIWYFPFSWIIAVGIPIGFLILQTMFKGYQEKPFNKLNLTRTLPFWVMFFLIQYNAFKGVLLLQHRFIGTLVILSLPFIAVYFQSLSPRKIKLAWIFGILTVSLSFLYNINGIIPVPRLKKQKTVQIKDQIIEHINDDSFLLLDFIGWEETYYLALRSKLSPHNIVMVGGAKNSGIPMLEIKERLDDHAEGLILLKKNSALFNDLNRNQFKIGNHQLFPNEVYTDEQLILYSITHSQL